MSVVTMAGVAIIVVPLVGCSVYTSQGRRDFEKNAPSKIQQSPIQPMIPTGDTCWTQPSRDPLWEVPDQGVVTVQSLNDETIEVCLDSGI